MKRIKKEIREKRRKKKNVRIEREKKINTQKGMQYMKRKKKEKE